MTIKHKNLRFMAAGLTGCLFLTLGFTSYAMTDEKPAAAKWNPAAEESLEKEIKSDVLVLTREEMEMRKKAEEKRREREEKLRREKEERRRREKEEAKRREEEQKAEAERKAREEQRAEEEKRKDAEARAAEEKARAAKSTQTVSADASDLHLLASLIYCEAGNQPYEGQVAVGSVVMNRVESASYPNSIREVIYQSGQFGPAATGWLDQVSAGSAYTEQAFQAARDAVAGSKPVGGCLYFGNGNQGIKLGDHYFH